MGDLALGGGSCENVIFGGLAGVTYYEACLKVPNVEAATAGNLTRVVDYRYIISSLVCLCSVTDCQVVCVSSSKIRVWWLEVVNYYQLLFPLMF